MQHFFSQHTNEEKHMEITKLCYTTKYIYCDNIVLCTEALPN